MSWNPYSHMKSKCKKEFDDTVHIAYLMNVLLSMFEYENLPDTLPSWLIETMLITEGSCGVCEINGKLYTGTGGFCGNFENFVSTEYQITNTGIGNKQGIIGKDFAVGYNNSTKTPDWYLMQVASILTEIDVSERCNVLFSRFIRIPKVKDSKEKVAVENAIKSISDGKFTAVISDNVLDTILDGENEKDKFLDLVDVKEVDKLQYLNQYRDNIVKRFFQHYGQGMQTTPKLAQQTTEEIHGSDVVSMIIVSDRLKQRELFVEKINNLFDTNISVKFSDCWLDQKNEMLDNLTFKGGENYEKNSIENGI